MERLTADICMAPTEKKGKKEKEEKVGAIKYEAVNSLGSVPVSQENQKSQKLMTNSDSKK